MKKNVKLIESNNEFIFVDTDTINVGESYFPTESKKSGETSSLISESILDSGLGYRILSRAKKLGWIASGESAIKKFVRAELRPNVINSIRENNNQCSIEMVVKTKTFGTNESDFYESDTTTPFLINNLPIILV